MKKYYIDGFGLDEKRALLINSDEITLAGGKHFSEVFTDNVVDLSLRYCEPKSQLEKLQQESIFIIDDWCIDYEQKIREKGGVSSWEGSALMDILLLIPGDRIIIPLHV